MTGKTPCWVSMGKDHKSIVVEGLSPSEVRKIPGYGYTYSDPYATFERQTATPVFPPASLVMERLMTSYNVKATKEALAWFMTEQADLARAYKAANDRDPISDAENLYPFQRAGYRFLLAQKRVLLADEVGLGKTIQTLSAVDTLLAGAGSGIVIVATKKSLISQWASECEIWLSSDVTVTALEKTYKRKEKFEEALNAGGKTVIIVNWEALLSYQPSLGKKTELLCFIGDEAHKVSSRKSSRSVAAKFFCLRSDYVFLATGTPLETSPADLWHLVSMLYPKVFSSYWNWYNTFVKTIRLGKNGHSKIIGSKNDTVLFSILAKFYLRRLRKDELKDVKEPRIITIPVKLSPAQAKVYRLIETENYLPIPDLEITTPLARMVHLRRAAIEVSMYSDKKIPSAKYQAVLDLVEDLDEPAIVFTTFRKPVFDLVGLIGDNAMPFLGGHDPEMLADFGEPGKPQILVATTSSAGTGLNLQKARIMIFLDLPWSGRLFRQAMGRVVRIGQSGECLVYILQSDTSADAHTTALIKAKNYRFSKTMITRSVLDDITKSAID